MSRDRGREDGHGGGVSRRIEDPSDEGAPGERSAGDGVTGEGSSGGGRPGEGPLARRLGGPVRAASVLGGWALLLLSFLIGLEVVLRKLFDTSLQGADEIGGYTVAIVVAFGAAHALIDRAHTRIDLFVERCPRRLGAALNAVAMVALALLALFLAWRGGAALADSIAYRSLSGTPLQTPLWIPQSIWTAGLVFFALVATAAAVHAIVLAVRDSDAANAWYGARTLRDEIGEERESARRRGVTGGSEGPAA